MADSVNIQAQGARPALPEWFYDIDVHTHDPQADHEAIVCLTPEDSFGERRYYSVGIHPWDAARADERMFERLREMASDPRVVAIGECGLDRRHTPAVDMAVQEEVFVRQAELAESLGKPLIIHCVGAFNELVELKKRLKPSVPWIVHGFRGKPELARELVRQGFYLSLGLRFNPAVPASVSSSALLRETDTTPHNNR